MRDWILLVFPVLRDKTPFEISTLAGRLIFHMITIIQVQLKSQVLDA